MIKKGIQFFIVFIFLVSLVGCATATESSSRIEESSTKEESSKQESSSTTTIVSKFNVTFNTLGGSAIETQIVEEGNAVTLPTAPTKDGFDFDGWFIDEDCTIAFTNSGVTSDIVLYAKWKAVEVVGPLAPITLYMIGDSTCAYYDQETKDLDYYYQRAGFGTGIAHYFGELVKVVNLGVGGASSKSYTTLDQYTTFKSGLESGDYVIIAFGHNDEKKDETKFATLINNGIETEGTFHYYLYNNFIKLIKEKGATPILATPIVRYDAKNDYAEGSKYLHNMQEDSSFGGGDYAQATRDLATSCEIGLIDNTRLTATKWKSTTEGAGSRDYYGMISSTAEDGTHLNTYGAMMVGYLMAKNIAESDSGLAKYVKADMVEPTRTEYLIVNPKYVEPTYTPPSSWSAYWETTGDWHGSVFGALRKDPKKNFTTYYDIKENDNQTVTIDDKGTGATANYATGQFNSQKDGILMYFQQLSINADFVLEATLHLDSIQYVNNAGGFGLMVRDDMYIDYYKADLASNFIAVGNLGTPFGSTSASPYTYKAFRRDGAGLERLSGDKTTDYLQVGESVNLKIQKIDSTYSLFYNGVKTAGNYDLSLAGDDKEFIYVGLFVAGVTCTFSNITLTKNI